MEPVPGLGCAASVQAETNPASKTYFIQCLIIILLRPDSRVNRKENPLG
jgi:hypothetical protein